VMLSSQMLWPRLCNNCVAFIGYFYFKDLFGIIQIRLACIVFPFQPAHVYEDFLRPRTAR
jgi:hypothetical protein